MLGEAEKWEMSECPRLHMPSLHLPTKVLLLFFFPCVYTFRFFLRKRVNKVYSKKLFENDCCVYAVKAYILFKEIYFSPLYLSSILLFFV